MSKRELIRQFERYELEGRRAEQERRAARRLSRVLWGILAAIGAVELVAFLVHAVTGR